MIYFADTNFFLECKSFQNLDWKEITDDDNIELYICHPVVDEIDKHKSNPQKKRKTINIQKLLNDLLQDNKQKEFYLSNNTYLTIRFADIYQTTELKTVEGLDLSIKDDEIIANVVLFNKKSKDKATLLTHDYGMRLKAERFIDVLFVPETWLLFEKDDVEKENERLKAELSQLQKKEPVPECRIFINNIELSNNLKECISFALYDTISDEQIEYYMQRMEAHCPKVLEYDVPIFEKQIQRFAGYRYVGPSQSKIDEYNKKYAEWLKHQRYVLETFSKKHNELLLIYPIRVELENTGSVPAESFEIEIFSNTGNFFWTDNLKTYKEKHVTHFHVAPEAPKGEFKNATLMNLLPADFDNTLISPTILRNYYQERYYHEQSHEESRDKFRFYTFYENKKLKIQCDEMQHQKGRYILECYFLIDEDKIKNRRIDFSYQIYAKNIAKTKTLTHTIDVEVERISALELIEKELKERDCI